MQTTEVLAKHALAYRVAIAAPYLASVELRSEFELVVRSIPGAQDPLPTQRIRLDDASYDINDLVLDAAQGRAYVASSAGWVRSYSLKDLTIQAEWRTGSGATALALSADQKYLLIGTDSGVICLRRLRDGAQLQCMVAHEGRIASLVSTEKQLASASWKGEVALWSLPALQKISQLPPGESVADLAISPDHAMLAVARNRRAPIRSQAIDDAEKRSPLVDLLGINRIELHGLSEAGISQKPIHKLAGHRGLISSIAFVGADLVSGSWDRSVQLWNTKSGSRTWRTSNFPHIVRDLAADRGQASFAIAGWAPSATDPAISWSQLRYPRAPASPR
jgi:WD40 repeat protein